MHYAECLGWEVFLNYIDMPVLRESIDEFGEWWMAIDFY